FRSTIPRPPRHTLFPYTTLFPICPPRPRNRQRQTRQNRQLGGEGLGRSDPDLWPSEGWEYQIRFPRDCTFRLIDDRKNGLPLGSDRKSTRLNSSHVKISYAVFCLK